MDTLDDGVRYVTFPALQLVDGIPKLARHVQDRTNSYRLETAWNEALNNSVVYFRALLSSSGSSAWKLVSAPSPSPASTVRGSSAKAAQTLGRVSPSDVAVHRRNGKGGEVFRAVVEVDCGSDINADTFRGSLATPETRAVCEFETMAALVPSWLLFV